MTPALAPAACLGEHWHATADLLLRGGVVAALAGMGAWAAARRFFPGRRAFVALCAAIAAWTVASIAEHAVEGAACKGTLALAGWLAIVWTPVLWAIFLHQYLNSATRAPALPLRALAVVPGVLLSLAVVTNGAHGLFYGAGTALGPAVQGMPRLRYDYGPLFALAVAVGYAWLAVAAVQVVRGWLQARPGDRRQWVAFVVVMAIPVAFNVAYLAFGWRLLGADPTVVGFSASVLGFAWLIARGRLFDVVPLARRVLFMELPEPVLVLDARGRVVEANRAAQFGGATPLGRPLAEWPRVGAALAAQATADASSGGSVTLDAPYVVYDVRRRALGDGPRRLGTMIVLNDVTAHRRAHTAVVETLAARDAELSAATALQARLRDQALRDPLTGAHNRRALEETFRDVRAQSAAGPLVLVLADLDHFKRINDRFGHATGDAVLRDFADALRGAVRSGDVVFRIGGEEFALLLPGVSADHAVQRLDRVRERLSARPPGALAERVTFSAGIAVMAAPTSLEAAMAAADRALYAAKTRGRDRSEIAPMQQ